MGQEGEEGGREGRREVHFYEVKWTILEQESDEKGLKVCVLCGGF